VAHESTQSPIVFREISTPLSSEAVDVIAKQDFGSVAFPASIPSSRDHIGACGVHVKLGDDSSSVSRHDQKRHRRGLARFFVLEIVQS